MVCVECRREMFSDPVLRLLASSYGVREEDIEVIPLGKRQGIVKYRGKKVADYEIISDKEAKITSKHVDVSIFIKNNTVNVEYRFKDALREKVVGKPSVSVAVPAGINHLCLINCILFRVLIVVVIITAIILLLGILTGGLLLIILLPFLMLLTMRLITGCISKCRS